MPSVHRIQYNGLTIENGSGYTINESGGHDNPPVRTSSDLLTGGHGGNVWEQKYDMRRMFFNGTIYGTDVDDYFSKRRALNAAFAINSLNVLAVRMWDSTERSIGAYVVSPPEIVNKIGETDHCDFRVELICPDPFFYDSTGTSGTMTLGSGGGFPVPTVVPTPVGGTTGDTVILTNSGDVEVYPTVYIRNACTNPRVTNTTTGQYFGITGTFVDGDVITAYRDNTGIFYSLNGSTNLMSVKVGDLFSLQVGVNVLRFSAGTSSTTAECEVTYYNRYLSV